MTRRRGTTGSLSSNLFLVFSSVLYAILLLRAYWNYLLLRMFPLSVHAWSTHLIRNSQTSVPGRSGMTRRRTVPVLVPSASNDVDCNTTKPVQGKVATTESQPPRHDKDHDTKRLKSILQDWINHSHEDYHSFTNQEAKDIRSALLTWYSKHRRKLPWRGDPPPFDGSTSGINSKKASMVKQNRLPVIDLKGSRKKKKVLC